MPGLPSTTSVWLPAPGSWLLFLPQSYPIDGILRGHIGENYPIAQFESCNDLNESDGMASELDLDFAGVCAVRVDFKQSDGAFFLAEGGTADIQDIRESCGLDGAIDTEIRARSRREGAVEGDIHRDCAV